MIEWRWREFQELNPDEMYAIWALREEVFVVEQKVVYLDADGRDPAAQHLMGWQNRRLVAYARVLPPNTRFPELSIGRVVTSPTARSQGAGRALMNEALRGIRQRRGAVPIRISAQAYLEKFYSSLGFVKQGEQYLEDTIPHWEMLYSNSVR